MSLVDCCYLTGVFSTSYSVKKVDRTPGRRFLNYSFGGIFRAVASGCSPTATPDTLLTNNLLSIRVLAITHLLEYLAASSWLVIIQKTQHSVLLLLLYCTVLDPKFP